MTHVIYQSRAYRLVDVEPLGAPGIIVEDVLTGECRFLLYSDDMVIDPPDAEWFACVNVIDGVS